MFLVFTLLLAVAPAMVRPSPPLSNLPRYTIIPIVQSPNPRYKEVSAWAINDEGYVACTAVKEPDKIQIFYLWKRGNVRRIGIFPSAINDRNQVIGETMSFPSPSFQIYDEDGAIWQNGKILRIFSNGCGTLSGINQRGEIVGSASNDPGAHTHAVLWDHGHLQDLGVLPGCQESYADAINESGTIAGECDHYQKGEKDNIAAVYYPCLYTDGKWLRIGDLSTSSFTHFSSGDKKSLLLHTGVSGSEYAINDKGMVVIHWQGYTKAGIKDPTYLWDHGRVTNITGFWHVFGINNDGIIIGVGEPNLKTLPRALIWQNGRIIDLNTLLPPHSGWFLSEARGINNRGEIVGSGTLKGKDCGFLMTPAASSASKVAAR
ncbi:MAG TPA: hypothetical protein VFW40_02690 [Capsulimonadaceae bacterium]|nr:hypothetical protein [Capsulimonadaceae bacterium]